MRKYIIDVDEIKHDLLMSYWNGSEKQLEEMFQVLVDDYINDLIKDLENVTTTTRE